MEGTHASPSSMSASSSPPARAKSSSSMSSADMANGAADGGAGGVAVLDGRMAQRRWCRAGREGKRRD
jgi:hypothetical protein